MASREEQPAHDWAPKSRSAPSAAPGERACDAPRRSGCTEPSGAALSGGCESPAPRLTVAAAPERPGQSDGADVTAASSNHEHLAAVPVAHANADSTAAVTAPVVASGYAGSSYVGAQ